MVFLSFLAALAHPFRSEGGVEYVRLIKDMYNNVVTSVRTSDGDTNDFPIRIGLQSG